MPLNCTDVLWLEQTAIGFAVIDAVGDGDADTVIDCESGCVQAFGPAAVTLVSA